MKLLYITEYFPSTTQVNIQGGVESRTYYLAIDLAKRHKVTVLASWEQAKPSYQKLDGVDVWRIGPKRPYIASLGKLIHRILFMFSAIRHGIRVDFDIVEGTGYLGWLPARIVSSFKGKAGVLWVPDFVDSYTGKYSFFLNTILILIQRLLITGNISLVCISHEVKRKLLTYGITPRKIYIIYCGVDTEYIRKIKVKKKSFPVICVVSRLVPYKRVDETILAVSSLAKEVPELKLEIIGSGEERHKLKKLINDLGLLNNVQIRGFLPRHRDVLRFIKSSWVYCQPSVIEGFGIALVEALAAGVPAVISDIPVHREITQNRGVLYYQPGSVARLTQQLKHILTNKTLYRKLSRQAVTIANKYENSRMVETTEKLYANLCHH